MSFITHLKSFSIVNYEPINNIEIISDLHTKRYCAGVFTWIGVDAYSKNIVLPDTKEINDIPGAFTLFLPTHSQMATCLLYTNKNPINTKLFYCERDLLPYLKQCVNLPNDSILVISGGDPILQVSIKEFHQELKQHFFTISPNSSGVDSSRTWEALYEQTIPIVQRSILTEFYSKIFPMVILDDWEELANYKFDHSLYYDIMSKYPDYTQYLDARNLWKYILEEVKKREQLHVG